MRAFRWTNSIFFFFKQKTAYEIKECDWSSDVCSSDLLEKPPATPAQFKEDMLHLMDAIQSVTTNSQVRFILLSPIRHEDFGMDAREIAKHNEILASYTKDLREIADSRNCEFVSLFDGLRKGKKDSALTDNGIH